MDQQVVRLLRIIALLLAILVVQVGWIGIQLLVSPVRAQIMEPIRIREPITVGVLSVLATDPIPVVINDGFLRGCVTTPSCARVEGDALQVEIVE